MTEPSTVTLADGRRLAYEECGRADGAPVFCFHGNPGSRLLWTLFDEVAQRRDLRIVAPDRPGFGGSDFQPDRDLLDWPADVAELADALSVDRFGVVGFSAGGPHAAACARELPDSVRRVALVSSVPPPSLQDRVPKRARGAVLAGPADTPSPGGATTEHDLGLYAAWRSLPGVSWGVFGATGWLARNWRRRFKAALAHSLSEHDADLFRQPASDVIVGDAVEAFRQGSRGPAHEFPMLAEDWGFAPGDLQVSVSLWHGSADRLVDPAGSEAFADAVPDGEFTRVDAGHYSTLVEHAESILGDVSG